MQTGRHPMRKLLDKLSSFPKTWLIVIVPLLTITANLILSQAQNDIGFVTILESILFLILLFVVFIPIYHKCNIADIDKIVYPRIEGAISQPLQDSSSYEYLFCESIITDKALSEMEKTCNCEEIWVVSNDLQTEIDGGLYADIVPDNLNRGIKYKIFVQKNNTTLIRIESLKRKHNNSPNIEYFLLTDDFFFLVSKLDFTIYDPYKTSSTGRLGYIGLDLPGKNELYAAKIGDDLVDAIASKLLENMKKKKFEIA